jgi:hypothetical protein
MRVRGDESLLDVINPFNWFGAEKVSGTVDSARRGQGVRNKGT